MHMRELEGIPLIASVQEYVQFLSSFWVLKLRVGILSAADVLAQSKRGKFLSVIN